ncbi:MAG: AmmeMemoRadiSam system radical SAM enzyme [Dehalococcoidales bacterium]|nr:AmmeMemoRadiSam system radical SAM enzyme [Dehalococcoidales bacterium]
MREALLYENLDQKRVRCNICNWRCRINPDKTGVCRMYLNKDGVLYSLNYALPSSIAVDPIEKKPLNHFYPGTSVFSMGSWGCNFSCRDCQNWQISTADGNGLPDSLQKLQPEEAVRLALGYGAQGIAWTYNEPTVWFEYTLDTAQMAKQQGLYTVYVTNGFISKEALDLIGPHLDAWRVDVKGFSDEFYRKWSGIKNWRSILDNTECALKQWGMHVEVVTNIVPGMNDDEGQLRGIADWIKASLGELIPWHVTRFQPYETMRDAGATPLATLEKAVEIGKAAGLKFVYIGNVPDHRLENTFCYNCGRLIIARQGYNVEITGLQQGHCAYCGADLNIRMAKENV